MEITNRLLKTVIYDQHEVIRHAEIVPREYRFEPNGNYVLVGLRRAGKSTILYKIVQDLIASGFSWDRIIYINFEDERLTEFTVDDFNKVLSVQAEMSPERGVFFFDEIQNIDGWEKFARRMADSGERVYITGSNAKMLSRDIERTLGGRYFSIHISPYNFREYLDAENLPHDEQHQLQTTAVGRIKSAFSEFFNYGGFPENVRYLSKREYVSGIYQKILLGDIIARNNIRNENAIRILIKKIAESVREPVSFTRLHSILSTIGVRTSKDTVIEYVKQAEDAYLIFELQDYYAKFADRESNPKYYFYDNGLVNLFLVDKSSILLENLAAIKLKAVCGNELYYLKSAKTGIDVDFYAPEYHAALQVAYEISDTSGDREIGNLIALSKLESEVEKFVIVTYDQECTIQRDGVTIQVIPAWKFCLNQEIL
jgi:predicted AAA+ superfamily ATPase